MLRRASPRLRRLSQSMQRVLAAARPRRRDPADRGWQPPDEPQPSQSVALDPVRLVTLAIDRLGPATFRSAAIGKPVDVVVPDADTAAIFRAALARTSRSTDRLLTIVVASDPVP